MTKKAILIFLPTILLLIFTCLMYINLYTKSRVTIAITGYDPIDLLSGHYIRYQIDWNNTDCSQFDNNICPKKEFEKYAEHYNSFRFYIPENQASSLENKLRKADKAYVVFAYDKKTRPIAVELIIDDFVYHSQK